jgi:hypothetical protein
MSPADVFAALHLTRRVCGSMIAFDALRRERVSTTMDA